MIWRFAEMGWPFLLLTGVALWTDVAINAATWVLVIDSIFVVGFAVITIRWVGMKVLGREGCE